MKRSCIILFFLGLSGNLLGQEILTTRQYISDYKDIAESEMRRTGVPAAISLAQGIVESNSGNGWLARYSNNHFGIKCKGGWTGETVAYTDDAPDECFRKYVRAEDSWQDHSDFLRESPRYAFLFQLKPTDYTDWAYGLKRAGYATSPTYARRLIQTIEDYNLEQYTLRAMGLSEGDTSGEQLEFIGDDQSAPALQAPPVIHDYPTGVFRVNGKSVVYLSRGAALLPLAEQYSIKLRDLLNYNDLEGDQPLAQDMLIFLEKKAQYGPESFHLVQPGETMYDISQQEGIQLKWLLKRNKMEKGEEPVPGEKLYLIGFASEPPHLMPPQEVEASAPGEQRPSLVAMAREVQSGIRKALNRDPTRTPETPMKADPVEDSSGHDPSQAYAQSGTTAVPLVRQWPDTALTDPQAANSDTQAPQSSSRVILSRDNPPPRRHWPEAHLKGGSNYHNYSRDGYLYHVVQPGETFSGIATRFGTPVSELLQWNRVAPTHLKVGQRLIIGREGQ